MIAKIMRDDEIKRIGYFVGLFVSYVIFLSICVFSIMVIASVFLGGVE